MKTINSISGGKSSCYIAINYPADYNVFSLVRTNDKLCEYPDKKVRQIVSDLIGCEFVGTTEQDNIIRVMLDLSEKVDIQWITGKPFEEIINGDWNRGKNGSHYLPNMMVRYCTTHLKMYPIFEWWKKEVNEVCEMRIGFRKGEEKRQKRMIEKLNDNGNEEIKIVVGKHENGNNKWGVVEWRKPTFPLIDNNVRIKDINDYWLKNKEIRFAKGYYNNCVGCFHRNPLFLNKMAQEHANKMEWFAKQEEMNKPNTFRKGITYREIINFQPQTELQFEDFNDCDTGYCGL
jgi:hypothetical protein|tara:strand:- start:2520 stop:3386 length:867 start_codon:yes stop_codon:yes gene_type:complete